MAKALGPKNWKDIACALGVVFFLGILLTILRSPMSEGFQSQDVIQCDVYSPCPGHLKCINGFCAKTDPVSIHEAEPLELLPNGEPLPYPEEN